jgi:chromosome segregation ATPase
MNGSQPAPTGVLVALKGKVKELQRQMNDLKQETEELRRRERQFLVQKRMVETTWARVQKVQFMAKGLESSLASSRLDGARAEARLEEAEGEIRALRQREAALVMDRDRCLQELDVIRRQLGGVGNARGGAFSKGTHGRQRDCPRR